MTRKVTHSNAIVLQSIAKGYRHGFDIIELTGLGGGTVYPALRRLERDGLLRADWEPAEIAQASGRPPRKYYELTETGERSLHEALERFRFLRPFAAQLEPKAVES
ncbi:MAG: PadR family transcriptional regulator [Thermoanaerobaculia bacterium]|nr:PadR family transcriptional regulator [Thermoanaerobaculia bacterium]